MAEVISFKTAQKFPRGEDGLVILERGQKWIDRSTGKMWVIAEIDIERVDDEAVLSIYLIDLQGKSSDNDYYTEDYFREWFDEAGDYWSWRLQTVYGDNKPRKRELVVVQGGKKLG